VIRCWRSARWYVEKQRALRGSNFAEHFEWLAERASDFQRERYPNDQVKQYDSA
jgi:hypothetical protein